MDSSGFRFGVDHEDHFFFFSIKDISGFLGGKATFIRLLGLTIEIIGTFTILSYC